MAKKQIEENVVEEVLPLGYYRPITLKSEYQDEEPIIGFVIKVKDNPEHWLHVNTELEAINLNLQFKILRQLGDKK